MPPFSVWNVAESKDIMVKNKGKQLYTNATMRNQTILLLPSRSFFRFFSD
jgi:hypothetical protein